MELIQCIESVYARTTVNTVVEDADRELFKSGYVYPVYQDEEGLWLATDEEDAPHVISDQVLEDDSWFKLHFRRL